MSVYMIGKAFKVKDLGSGEKLVLLALADYARDDGLCWPGIDHLSEKSSCSTRTVRRHIAALKKKGYLRVILRKRANGSYRTSMYQLFPDEFDPPKENGSTDVTIHDLPPQGGDVDDTGVVTNCQGGGDKLSPLEPSIETYTRIDSNESIPDAQHQDEPVPKLPPANSQKGILARYIRLEKPEEAGPGWKLPNFAREAKAASLLSKEGYKWEDIAACYRHLKAGWYRDKHLSLMTVRTNLPAFLNYRAGNISKEDIESGKYKQFLSQDEAYRRLHDAEKAGTHQGPNF